MKSIAKKLYGVVTGLPCFLAASINSINQKMAMVHCGQCQVFRSGIGLTFCCGASECVEPVEVVGEYFGFSSSINWFVATWT